MSSVRRTFALLTASTILVISAILLVLQGANGQLSPKEQELLKRYAFDEWAGKTKGPSVFHCNIDIRRVLRDEFMLDSWLGGAKGKTRFWALGFQASFWRKPRRRIGPVEDKLNKEPLCDAMFYECDSILQAHQMLCFSLAEGAGPPPPNRCLKGVEVGDKCFTGRAKDTPNTIYFVRGNVVVRVRGPDSVLDIAQIIDGRLCLTELQEARLEIRRKPFRAPVETVEFQRVGAPFEIASNVRSRQKQVSVRASGGRIYIDDKDRLVLVSDKPAIVRVRTVSKTLIKFGEEMK